MLKIEGIKNIIDTNYNRFFKCADIVNDVIAVEHNVTIRDLMDCRKRVEDPFAKYRRGLSVQIARVLVKLRDAGYIEKYGRYVWRIVK